MKNTLMILITLVVSFTTLNAQWFELVTPTINYEIKSHSFIDLEISLEGEPYLLYDVEVPGEGWKLFVQKYNLANEEWGMVGEGPINDLSATDNHIAMDSEDNVYVAYMKLGGGPWCTVKKFDGTEWIQIGEWVTGVIMSDVTMYCDNKDDVYISYYDTDYPGPIVKRYLGTGSDWETIGNESFHPSGQCLCPAITTDNDGNLFVSYGGDDFMGGLPLSVKKFNGTSWEFVGANGFYDEPNYPTSIIVGNDDVVHATTTDFWSLTSTVLSYLNNVWQPQTMNTYDNGGYLPFTNRNNDIFMGYCSSDNPYNKYKPLMAKLDASGTWVDLPEQPGPYCTTTTWPMTYWDIEADNFGNLYLSFLKGDHWNHHLAVIKLDITTGIAEMQKENSVIYPNPTSGTINIKTQPDEIVHRVLVTDISGKLVFRDDNGNSIIDLSILENGVYFVKLETNNGTHIEKIIIQ